MYYITKILWAIGLWVTIFSLSKNLLCNRFLTNNIHSNDVAKDIWENSKTNNDSEEDAK